MPKRPEWFSLRSIKANPLKVITELNKTESIELAKYFDYRYHEKNKPVVSDEVYDLLIDRIKERWPKAAYLKKVGHKVTTKGRKEVTLPINMPSLDKVKPETKDLSSFLKGSVVLMDKLDGISLLLEYRKGRPYACYTRGNGTRGQDVSGVLPALNIPKTIPEKSVVLIRCEFIIGRKTFSAKHAKISGKGEYKTSRNMGGGLLTRNEPSSAVSDFNVVAYEIPKGKGAGAAMSAQLTQLKRWGFTPVRHKKVSGLDVETLTEMLDKFRKTAKYDIDGIVVAQDKAYTVSKKNPKHAKAFKVNSLAASEVVTVKDVEWNRSRYGKLIPRVIVDPIQLGGVTVENFTGHNYFYIQNGFRYQDRNKKMPVRPLGKGAQIRVIRSGDVIPYIMEVVKPARRPSKPDVEYSMDETGVHAMAVREKGVDDPELRKKRLVQFFSAMKMKGVKSGIIEKLYDAGFRTLKSILHASPEKLQRAEGIKEKTAQNVVATIANGLSNARFAQTAYASSIFGDKIGSTKLQAVIDHFPNIMEMTQTQSPMMLQDQLEEVAGIKTQAKMLSKGLPKFARFLERNRITLQPEPNATKASSKLEGIKVLFTSLRDDELMQDILANGGQKAASVKSATHVVAKPGASNNKISEAQDKDIPIMTVDEFREEFRL